MTTDQRDGEYWRQQGYALVMRYGSVKERIQAQNRLLDLEKIREQTRRILEAQRSSEAWLAQRQREAA